MRAPSSIAGADAAGRWARLFASAAIAAAQAACTTTPHAPPTDGSSITAAPAEPASAADAQSAPTGQPAVDESPRADAPDSAQPPPAQLSAAEAMIESQRRAVRSSVEWLARGVDNWFGDRPFEDGGRVTDVRLSMGSLKREGEDNATNVRFNARLRLPNVEERTYLFIGRDNERAVVADTPGAFSRQDRLLAELPEERSFFAGVGFALRETLDLRIGFRGIRPYAQARYRQPWTLSERDLVEFRQTIFWRLDDRLGSTTALSYEHAVSSNVAVRWLSATTITQQTEKFDWSSILGGYKAYGGQRLLSLELIATGRQGTGVTVSDFGVQAKWLQPVYLDWLLGEVMVGHFWPRRDPASERTESWALGAVVTMRF